MTWRKTWTSLEPHGRGLQELLEVIRGAQALGLYFRAWNDRQRLYYIVSDTPISDGDDPPMLDIVAVHTEPMP